jgi:uncharacterized membrane protein YciS (DUF1049 family)
MKIGVPATGPLGDRFEVWTVREPDDPLASVPWIVCIRDSSNNVVYSRQVYHDIGIDPDIKVHLIDITSLSQGVYRVDIYDWVNCDPPLGVDTYSIYIHKKTSGTVLFGLAGSWYPDRQYIFTVYVAYGRLFYQSSSERAVFIPANANVFVEVTGSDGSAYVGVVNTSSDVRVAPNASIPFMARLRFTLDMPKALDVARAYANVVGFARGVAVKVVDDYTFDIIIAKSEFGLGPLVAALVILGFVAVIVWGVALIVGFTVELEKVNTIKKLSDERKEVVQRYLNEYDMCTDDSCRRYVHEKYLPIIQGYDAAIGALSSTLATGACNGVNIGGICVPWWVVGIVVFLAGLLVIAALK